MHSEKFIFENKRGEKLSARLDFPVERHPLAYALFAHCFTCSKNLHAVRNISRALTEQGVAVLRFDFTGLGESEGDFADTNFSSNIADLIAAADFLGKNFEAPRILIGHSLGGAAVLQAAGDIPACKAVATIGAPCDPAHVAHLLQDAREEIEERGEAQVNLAGRIFTVKKQFLEDLEMTVMREKIANLKRALLIFHSPVDDTVGIENAQRIYKAALHPKSFVSLDTADHLLTNEADSRYVGEVLAVWAKKYIELGIKSTKMDVQKEEGTVVVQTGSEKYYTTIMANGHALIADEPEHFGGKNLGASPYELLSASLGACTSITLRMYADRKKWPLKSVIVRLKHHKIHANDCQACESKNGKVDHIARELELFGPLDDAQKQRLLEIADKCPVHKTLHSEIIIKTRLRD